MGHKVNPRAFRITTVGGWRSKWFSSKSFGAMLRQDVVIRKYLTKQLRDAGVSKVDIERSREQLTITIYATKPGVIIGRSGAGIDQLKKEIIEKFINKAETQVPGKITVHISIQEVQQPNLVSQILLDTMIADIEKRIPYRRVLKQAVGKVERAGALGVKVVISGRLNGAEIARTEKMTTGRLPLHTLRADIDYARGCAQTIYGKIGLKVWIYRGDVFHKDMDAVGNATTANMNK